MKKVIIVLIGVVVAFSQMSIYRFSDIMVHAEKKSATSSSGSWQKLTEELFRQNDKSEKPPVKKKKSTISTRRVIFSDYQHTTN
ncbi:MAG: hypothetical protein WBA74_16885 [Cyclobacteriaceae bacterium]